MCLQREICDRSPRAVFSKVQALVRTKNEAHTAEPLILLAFWSPRTPRRKSFGAPKFAPKEAYISKLTDERLYINAASYYHDLPGE